MRTATKTRVTAETSIELSINLDSQVESTISTGVGFWITCLPFSPSIAE